MAASALARLLPDKQYEKNQRFLENLRQYIYFYGNYSSYRCTEVVDYITRTAQRYEKIFRSSIGIYSSFIQLDSKQLNSTHGPMQLTCAIAAGQTLLSAHANTR